MAVFGGKLDKRHSDCLTSRLEDAYLNGCSHITSKELYLWYGIQRIAAQTCRDLEERWQKVSKGEKGQLMQIKGRAGIFIVGQNTVERLDKSIEKFE